jgi:hypothetical protein
MNLDPGISKEVAQWWTTASCPFAGFWSRVGKAAVVLHTVANRTIDLYSIALFAAPRGG